jgi:hypothetical protein
MINQFRQRLVSCMLLIMFLSLTFACQFFSFGREEEISNKEAYYAIDPNTILDSLAQGATNVFTPQIATPEFESSIQGEPVEWSQSDYFRIADALHEFVWNESLDEWNLDGMTFGMDCKDVDYGSQYANFRFYKVVHTREKESRLVHNIYIFPAENSVWWTEIEYYPKLANWGSLDQKQIKVSVNDALQIAETNGGRKARLEVNNKCKFAAIIPIWEYEGWNLTYTSDAKLFNINIDPLTGEYRIISSN